MAKKLTKLDAKKMAVIDFSKYELDLSDIIEIGPIDPRRFPGMWPIPVFTHIPKEKLLKIVEGQKRLIVKGSKTKIARKKIIEGIQGGIRRAHLHIDDEIVFLDKKALQSYLKVAAQELDKIKDINQIEKFIQM